MAKAKQKVYLIPYYNDIENDKVCAYLFLKNLTNPHCSPIIKVQGYKVDSFKLGANKLWFAGGYPYPFGGNRDEKSITQCLKDELEEESHGQIKLDLFLDDWREWSNETWSDKCYKKFDNQTYYMLSLKTKLTFGKTVDKVKEEKKDYVEDIIENFGKKLHLDTKESTGIIVEIELTKEQKEKDILKQIQSKYLLGKDRFSEDGLEQELEECLSKFNKQNSIEAKNFFMHEFESWVPEAQFEESHTLGILGELFDLVNID